MSPLRIQIHRDLAYGEHPRHRLDLYQLEAPRPTPLVLWLHGGGFRGGSKDGAAWFMNAEAFFEAGFSVACANYRLGQHAPYPAAMLDGARALQFLRCHAADYGLDPERTVMAGNSAGGIISLWIAFHTDLADPSSPDPVSRQTTRLAAVAGDDTQTVLDPRVLRGLLGWEGPLLTDFLGIAPEDSDTPASRRRYEDLSPITHAGPHAPPVFLFYRRPMLGTGPDLPRSDRIHHPAFGQYLRERCAAWGVPCEVHVPAAPVPEDWPRRQFAAMAGFFRRHLAPTPATVSRS